jgi:tetratricopeptide (TPR) repeat protein
MSETERPGPAAAQPGAAGPHHLPGEGPARLIVLAPAPGWARRLAVRLGAPALVLAGPGIHAPGVAEGLAAALAEADDRPRILLGLGAGAPAALRVAAALGAAGVIALAPAGEAPEPDLGGAAALLAFDPHAAPQAAFAGALDGPEGIVPVRLPHAGDALADSLLVAGALSAAIDALLARDAPRAAMALRVGRLLAPGMRASLAARLAASGHARFAEGVALRAQRPVPVAWPREAEARVLQRLGRPAAAIEPLGAWLQRQPRDALARRRLAACFLALDQPARAVPALRLARAHGAVPFAVQARLVHALLRLRRMDEAVEAAEAAAGAAHDRAEGAALLGQTLLLAGRDGAAGEAFRQALALDPGHPLARAGVVVAAEPGGAQDPPAPGLAALLATMEAPSAGEAGWRALLQLLEAPGRGGVAAAAAAAVAAAPAASVLAQAARLLDAAGDVAAAEAAWRRLTVLAPGDPAGWVGLVDLLRRHKRMEEAAAVALQATTLHPDRLDLCLSAAECLLGSRDPVGAERQARRLLALDPRHEPAHLLLADALWRQHRSRDALRAAEAALDALPDSLAIGFRIANLLLMQNAPAAAAAAFRRLADRPKAPPTVWLMLTDALWRAGQVEEAGAAVREGLAAYPGHVELRARFGQLMLAGGDADAARAALAEASAAAPDSDVVHLALADALWRQGRRAEALAAAREAAARAPDNVGVAVRLGHLLLENGLIEEAVAQFERAIRDQPDLVAAWTGLCDAERTRKRIKPALEAYRRAEALGMDRGTRRLLRFRLFGEMEE